ncbi:MAG TPA: hypothetical protein VKE71_05405 [Candidatus Angelobacter sp.]|nr:hypothetical protein [Candidatus Angelobacter sp.]
MIKKIITFLLFAFAVLLLGCESEKPQQSSKPAGPELQTGRFALQKMIAPAHLWSADAQPVSLKSNAGKDNLGHDGKSGYWQALFVSPSKQKAQSFSWSGLVGAGAPPQGVDHGIEEGYSPTNRTMQPFDLSFLKSDSDNAFVVAQEHGGKQLLAKNPNQEVFYILDWNASENLLKWHVIYGTSPNNAQLTVIVNASTGDFIHKE